MKVHFIGRELIQAEQVAGRITMFLDGRAARMVQRADLRVAVAFLDDKKAVGIGVGLIEEIRTVRRDDDLSMNGRFAKRIHQHARGGWVEGCLRFLDVHQPNRNRPVRQLVNRHK